MKVLAFLFKYSRSALIWAVIAGIVSGAANTGLLALINSSLTDPGASRRTLLWSFIAMCVVVPLSRIASELLLVHLGQGTIYRMRIEMCRRILAVPLSHLESLGAPRLLSALTGDIPTITNVVITLPTLFTNLAILVASLIYLGLLSWKILLAALAIIALGILSYQIPVGRVMRHYQRAREVRDELYGHFRVVTEGTKELKLHHRRRQVFLDRILESAAGAYRDHQVRARTVYTFATSWGQLLLFMTIGLLLFAAPYFFGNDISLSTLTGYTLILLFMMSPLQVLMNAVPDVNQAEIALNRVEQMGLDLAKHAPDDAAEAPAEGGAWRNLELSGVTHVYHREGEDGEFVLGPINLRLEPGELVFIAGGNGSGKTSLAKVLVGLYPPESGEILLDGQPVTDANREAYRQHFSVVFSDFYLFEALLGLEAPELDERARRYLRELQLAHKVEIRDGRLSTTGLSQGQRKRLALLTAYLEDRPIYVFDEWAADQDPMFKEIFYRQILPDLARRGKTVVSISHDDRYYSAGDRIIKLDDGRITSDVPSAPHLVEPDHRFSAEVPIGAGAVKTRTSAP